MLTDILLFCTFIIRKTIYNLSDQRVRTMIMGIEFSFPFLKPKEIPS